MKRRTLATSSTSTSSSTPASSFPRRATRKKAKTTKKRHAEPATSVSSFASSKKQSSSRLLNVNGAAESVVDQATECHRLREQLERVLRDHQRQEEEIVGLRALARSLKAEVEGIRQRQQLQEDHLSLDSAVQPRYSHEFFELDVEAAQLRGENDELHHRVAALQQEAKHARASVKKHVLAYKLAAVKAQAELRGVKSQLQQERQQSDKLHAQVVRYKARHGEANARAAAERRVNQYSEPDALYQDSELDEKEGDEPLRLRREHRDFLHEQLQQQDAVWESRRHQTESYEPQETVKMASSSSSACRSTSRHSLTSSWPSRASLPPALSTPSLPDEMALLDDLHELNSDLETLTVSKLKKPVISDAKSIEM